MVRKADKIFFIDDGKVTESGTLDELVAKKGAFYAQWQSQKW
jgi:ABC-type multidrug transport system fused ATPase/permease subunit